MFVANDGRIDSASASFDITVVAAPCELIPLSLDVQAPQGLAFGKSVNLHWRVQNNGPGTTVGGSIDRVYLSRDATLDANDTLLGDMAPNASSLAPTKTYEASLGVTLPIDGSLAGDYCLLLDVNHYRDEQETNYANNLLAKAIRIESAIDLTSPYSGQFVDARGPLTVRWRDAHQAAATVTLAIDSDADPANGVGQTTLKANLPEAAGGLAYQADVTLPALPPGLYHLWARLTDQTGDHYSSPMPVRMFEEVHTSADSGQTLIGDPGSYTVFGVEMGRIGNKVSYRVRTNYDPHASGGDVHLNIGGSHAQGNGRLAGIAVRDRVADNGVQLHPGDLYLDASFVQGKARGVPAFLQSFQTRVTGQSSARVTDVTGQVWKHEIEGDFSLPALGASATTPLEIGWTMYCGNDSKWASNGVPSASVQNVSWRGSAAVEGVQRRCGEGCGQPEKGGQCRDRGSRRCGWGGRA